MRARGPRPFCPLVRWRSWASLRTHLDNHGFSDIEIRYLGGQRPGRVDPAHPLVTLASKIARDVYGKEPSLVPMVGGSGPIYPFVAGLRVPVVTCGCGYPGSRVHAPNENLRISDLLLGAKHTARFLAALVERGIGSMSIGANALSS